MGWVSTLTHIPPRPPSRDPFAKLHLQNFVRPTAETVGYVEPCTSTRSRSLSTFLVFVRTVVPPGGNSILVTCRYSRPVNTHDPSILMTQNEHRINDDSIESDCNNSDCIESGRIPTLLVPVASTHLIVVNTDNHAHENSGNGGVVKKFAQTTETTEITGSLIRCSKFARRRSESKTAEIEESTKHSMKTNTG